MTKKMKILAASDFHQDIEAVKKLAKQADKAKVDVVVIAGDLTYFDDDVSGMVGPFRQRQREVLFVPGNHDSPATADFVVEKYKARNLQYYAVVISDVGFFGCGGANVGPHFITEKEIADTLKRGFTYVKDAPKKVMVTHMHPASTLVEKFSFRGSKAVRKAIEEFKPDVHISGHIHETEGLVETIGKTKTYSIGKSGRFISV
ncbi:MAG: metallophosphoesterase family protein [Candidatus Aenigmarchaeota archaeon]|nr:metallophosphoesterase family protein [Candidatus Aenigmarchaeota archaeon]